MLSLTNDDDNKQMYYSNGVFSEIDFFGEVAFEEGLLQTSTYDEEVSFRYLLRKRTNQQKAGI
jgi:hypothetical protein